jgi:hypothetical protein
VPPFVRQSPSSLATRPSSSAPSILRRDVRRSLTPRTWAAKEFGFTRSGTNNDDDGDGEDEDEEALPR